MDEQAEAGALGGVATLSDFKGIIDEFAASHTQSQRAYEVRVLVLEVGAGLGQWRGGRMCPWMGSDVRACASVW